jgi:Uma2 family endonuclease
MEKKETPDDNSPKYYTFQEYLENERKSEVNEALIDYSKMRYTIEEYLDMERASDVKHEYYQGEIFAMSGASPRHNWMFTNVFGKLCMQLKGCSCFPYGSDMRMHIPENTLFTYPDISIYCGDPIEINEDTLIQPTVIIELLSPSTRSYDMGKKFELYRAIPTLKEYILIDTESIAVKSWRINAHNYWEPEEYKTLQDTVLIPAVEVSLSMLNIYEGTRLAEQVK